MAGPVQADTPGERIGNPESVVVNEVRINPVRVQVERPSRERIIRYYRFTILSAVVTVFFCCVSVIFFSLELNRLEQFTNAARRNELRGGKYYDKNYEQISETRLDLLKRAAQNEQAVLAAALFSNIVLVMAAAALIKGAIYKKASLFAFWGGSLLASYLVGLAYTLMDMIVYGICSRTNGMLLTWLGFGMLFGHCLKCVYRYHRMILANQFHRTHSRRRSNSHSRNSRAGSGGAGNCGAVMSDMAVFDASLWPDWPSNIFTIASLSASTDPSHITPPMPYDVAFQLPCYEEAVSSTATKPPYMNEKPPDYEP